MITRTCRHCSWAEAQAGIKATATSGCRRAQRSRTSCSRSWTRLRSTPTSSARAQAESMCSMHRALIAASSLVETMGLSLTAQTPSDVRLVLAMKNQDATTVKALLKQRADVNAADVDGTTALQWAAHWNDLDTVKALIA